MTAFCQEKVSVQRKKTSKKHVFCQCAEQAMGSKKYMEQEAHLVYYDPWLDYGFLKVDSKAILEEVTNTIFSSRNPVMDQSIFTIGNNERCSFSLHTGVIADLYEVTGGMPQQNDPFWRAYFFEMDDYSANINNIPAKRLTFVKADANHVFNNVAPDRIKDQFRLNVLSFNNKPVTSLKALAEVIPSLIANKYFTIEYTDLSPFYSFAHALQLGSRQSRAYVEHSAHISQPRRFNWDETTHRWVSSSLVSPVQTIASS